MATSYSSGSTETVASLVKVLAALARVVQKLNADDESQEDRALLDEFVKSHKEDK